MSQPPEASPPPSGDVPPPPGPSPVPPADSGAPAWDQPGGAPPPRTSINGMAITALVSGIIALLLCWLPFVNVLSLVLGIVAVVTGIVGIRRAGRPGMGQKGLAIGGLLTGVLGFIISVVILGAILTVLNDPGVREPFERIMEGEDPNEVLDELERELELEPR